MNDSDRVCPAPGVVVYLGHQRESSKTHGDHMTMLHTEAIREFQYNCPKSAARSRDWSAVVGTYPTSANGTSILKVPSTLHLDFGSIWEYMVRTGIDIDPSHRRCRRM